MSNSEGYSHKDKLDTETGDSKIFKVRTTFRFNKIWYMASFVILTLIFFAGIYFREYTISNNLKQSAKEYSSSCKAHKDLIKSAYTKLSNTSDDSVQSSIMKDIGDIEALSDHKSNPNCVIVLAMHYLNEDDVDKAEEYVSVLKSGYKDSEVFDFIKNNDNLASNLITEYDGKIMRRNEIKNNYFFIGGGS